MTPLKWLHGLPMPYYFLTLALLLCLLPGCFRPTLLAQGTTPPPARELAVGQPLPNGLLLQLVNHPDRTARLSDFKGKLLILDFWATWCSASRLPLPRLDSLQQAFGDQLQVLLVSYTNARDNRATVTSFFEESRRPDGSRYRLPSVVEDTTLINYFPHQRIPYFAWISPEGRLGALTHAEQVTAPNIRRALTEGVMPESLLPDIDLSQPLFTAATPPLTRMLHYSVLLKGKVDDSSARSQLRREGNAETGLLLVNMPLLDMYHLAKRHLYPAFGDQGLVLAGVDSALLFREKSGLSPMDWKARHLYSYDLRLPPDRAKDMYRTLLEDLNRYSGYTASLELREIDCLLLVRKGRQDRLKSKGGEPQSRLYSKKAPAMQNMPLTALVSRLNSNSALPLLVVDETGYTGRVDMEIRSGFSDLPALREALQAYGLALVPARKKVPLLVLRKQEQAASANTSF